MALALAGINQNLPFDIKVQRYLDCLKVAKRTDLQKHEKSS